MLHQRLLIASVLLAGTALPVAAQPISPPPPKEYRVHLRYRIYAGRAERVQQFYPMVAFLNSLGFKRDEGADIDGEAEDANLIYMTGTISSANARRLLEEPHVKSLLLLPPGFRLPGPEDAEAPVKVQIQLATGLTLHQQRLLAEQTTARLREFGFKEGIAYDHQGYSRLVGTVQGGELLTLLKDIRSEPSGWLVANTPLAALPSPFREASPIRVVEVIPEPAGVPGLKEVAAPPAVEKGKEFLQKITPELQALQAAGDDAKKPVRTEIILAATPNDESTSWEKELISIVPQLVIEGRFGPIVTAMVAPEKAPALAESPIVSTVRLPRSGTPLVRPTVEAKGRNRDVLADSGMTRLHSLGHRGKGVRVGVISGDFRGWEEMVKDKQLPAGTRLLDLTVQRVATIEPEPYPKDDIKLGDGTQAAMALALAAPQADLLLIRVDPASPHMLLAIARLINGEPLRNQLLEQRRDDIDVLIDDLSVRMRALLTERREILENFDASEEAIQKREALFQKTKELKEEEANYTVRMGRLIRHQRELRDLAKLNVVVNTLSWPESHLADGGSPLSRYVNNRPFRSTYWFQPAGDIRGQTWTGPFRDADGNGVMEFAPAGTKQPKGRWTSELNFLGWQTWAGKFDPELPDKAVLRVSVQWREAHEPQFLLRGEDLYREPLTKFRVMLLRQRDPSGQKVATDDMELIAYSSGLPQRIDNEPAYSTYQMTLEFKIDNPGVYAVRVEGKAPAEIRPPGTPNVPAIAKKFDLRLRFFAEVADAESRVAGRPVWVDFATNEGSTGMPGDANSLVTVGAADRTNRSQPYSSWGPPLNLELLPKPNFLSYDGLEVGADDPKGVIGTHIAAAYAAGVTTTALSAGVAPSTFNLPPGTLLRIPATWQFGKATTPTKR